MDLRAIIMFISPVCGVGKKVYVLGTVLIDTRRKGVENTFMKRQDRKQCSLIAVCGNENNTNYAEYKWRKFNQFVRLFVSEFRL